MPYSSSIQIVNDANGTAYAFLADNGAIWQCQWNAQAQRWEQGQVIPQAFGGMDPQVLYLPDLWPNGQSQGNSSNAGFVLAYRLGEGSSAEIYASFGAWGGDGQLSWSAPVALTNDGTEDQQFALVPAENGGFSLVVQKQEAAGTIQQQLEQAILLSSGQGNEQALQQLAIGSRPDQDLYQSSFQLTLTDETAVSIGLSYLSESQTWVQLAPLVNAQQSTAPVTSPPQLAFAPSAELQRSQLVPVTLPLTARSSTTLLGATKTSTQANESGIGSTSSGPSQSGWSAGNYRKKTSGGSISAGPGLFPTRYLVYIGGDDAGKLPFGNGESQAAALIDSDDSSDDILNNYGKYERDKLQIGNVTNIFEGNLLDGSDYSGVSDYSPAGRNSAVLLESDPITDGFLSKYGRTSKGGGGIDLIFSGLFGGVNQGSASSAVIDTGKLEVLFPRKGSSRTGFLGAAFFGGESGVAGTYSAIEGGGGTKSIFSFGRGIWNPLDLTSYISSYSLGFGYLYHKSKYYENGATGKITIGLNGGVLAEQFRSGQPNPLPEWLAYTGRGIETESILLNIASSVAGHSIFSSKPVNMTENLLTTSITRLPWSLSNNKLGIFRDVLSFVNGIVIPVATGVILRETVGKVDWNFGIFAAPFASIEFLSKYRIGAKAIFADELNYYFAGAASGKLQNITYASAGFAATFGAYIPLLTYYNEKSWQLKSPKGNTAAATDTLSSTDSSATTDLQGTPSSSGSFSSAGTGSNYPFVYNPNRPSNARVTSFATTPINALMIGEAPTTLYQFTLQASTNTKLFSIINAGAGLIPTSGPVEVDILGPSLHSTTISNRPKALVTINASGELESLSISQGGSFLYLPETGNNSGEYFLPLDLAAAGLITSTGTPPLVSVNAATVARSDAPLQLSPIQRIAAQLYPMASGTGAGSNQTYPQLNPDGTITPVNPRNNNFYSYTQVPTSLANAGTNVAIPLINESPTARVVFSNNRVVSIQPQQELIFLNSDASSSGYTLVADLSAYGTAIGNAEIAALQSISLSIPRAESYAYNNVVSESQFSSQVGASSSGVYIADGITDSSPLFPEYSNSPISTRVVWYNSSYDSATGQTTSNRWFLNATMNGVGTSVEPDYINEDNFTNLPSFSAASSPTAVTIAGSATGSGADKSTFQGDTLVAWVEATNPVIPITSSDGEQNFQSFMDAAYGDQRINYRINQANTDNSSGWAPMNAPYLAGLYQPDGAVITELRSFNVSNPFTSDPDDLITLLAWTEIPLPGSSDPTAAIKVAMINPNADFYQWSDLTTDANGSSTISTIPWDGSTSAALAINNISIAAFTTIGPDGALIETPVLSFSRDVRTPYRQSVLSDQPNLYLQFGALTPGISAINIGSSSSDTTQTYASETGLDFSIASAIPKSQSTAVANSNGTGVLITSLGSSNAAITDLLNQVPPGDLPAPDRGSIHTFTASIANVRDALKPYGLLNVTALSSGSLAIGSVLTGFGVLPGTTITEVITPFVPATADTAATAGSYKVSHVQTLASTTLKAFPDPTTYAYTSLELVIAGTTLTVINNDVVGALNTGDLIGGLGIKPGTTVTGINRDGSGAVVSYTVNIAQTVGSSAAPLTCIAAPGGSSSPYTIEFWTQNKPQTNPNGAGLVAYGQPSATAIGDADLPDGWLLESSFVVDLITYQQAAGRGDTTASDAIANGTNGADPYAWGWAVIADGADTTAMDGNGGANLYSNALRLSNLRAGVTLSGVTAFLEANDLTPADLTGLGGAPADVISSVPQTQLQFAHFIDEDPSSPSYGLATSNLNTIAIDTSSANLNQGFLLTSSASSQITTLFNSLWEFQQKTGEAKVTFSLADNPTTATSSSATPLSIDQFAGYQLGFSLSSGPAVSINGDGQIVFDVASGMTLVSADGVDYRDNGWIYVAASYLPDYRNFTSADGTLLQFPANSGTASLYINNNLVAQSTAAAPVIDAYAKDNVNDQLLILANNNQGAIDQLATYSNALSTETIPVIPSGWDVPNSELALFMLRDVGLLIDRKTPNPGAIPGAVTAHWDARNVNPNDAELATFYSVFSPSGGTGSWSTPSTFNPKLTVVSTIPSATSSESSYGDNWLLSLPTNDWATQTWTVTTATIAAKSQVGFNPSGLRLDSITVRLGNSSSSITLAPEQVLLGNSTLADLQPLSLNPGSDLRYTILSNAPAFSLLIDRTDAQNQDQATISFNFAGDITATSPSLIFNQAAVVQANLKSTPADSTKTGLSPITKDVQKNNTALATAAVIEQAPLQLKYIDSGEVFRSQSSAATANQTAASTPAQSFGTSQTAGFFSSTSSSTIFSGWLAIAQPRSIDAISDPGGRVWIQYTGDFTSSSNGTRTAVTDVATAPLTWLNALADSNFSPEYPNLPLLNSAINKSSSGGLMIIADATVGWGDNFGKVMLSVDLNGDGVEDLVISAPQANGGGRVYVIDGTWIQNNLTTDNGATTLNLANPDDLGDYVLVLTPRVASSTSTTDDAGLAGFGTALAFDDSTNTLWIGAPNYLRQLNSADTQSVAGGQPIGALYSFNSAKDAGGWSSAEPQSLTPVATGQGGTSTATNASYKQTTTYWGSMLGTAIAVSSDGALAVSAPGFSAGLLYSGTQAAQEESNPFAIKSKISSPDGDGALISVQLPVLTDDLYAVDITNGTNSSFTAITTGNSPTAAQSNYMQNLEALQTDNIVGATVYNNQAVQSEAVGAVYLYNNTSSGITTPTATIYGPNPWNVLGSSGFGSSLAFIDLNNTNTSQLAIGADATGGSGAVYLIDKEQVQSGANDLAASLGGNQYLAYAVASLTLYGAESQDLFGSGIVNLGDVNQDGYDDLQIQAMNAASAAGAGYVLFGSDQFDSMIKDNQVTGSVASGSIGLFSSADGTSFSSAILQQLGYGSGFTGSGSYGTGDLNADGINDIQLGSGPNSSAYLTWGHPYLEAVNNLALKKLASNTGYMLDGLATSNQGSLCSIGDFNADGYGDFISINPGNALTTVRIELGANTQEILADAAYNYYTFTVANGTEVLPGGDINGDGIDDIVLFFDQNLSSAADGNQGAGSSTGILYGRSSADLPLGSGFGFIAPVDPSTSAPLASLPGLEVEKAGDEVGLTDATPSVIAVGNTLYMAVKGATNDTLWFTQSTDGGNSWDNWSELPASAGFSTSTGPSLAYFNETLYLSFVDSAGTLSLSSWDPASNNPTAWSTPYQLSNSANPDASYSSSYSPQLIDHGDALGITWTAAEDNESITYLYSSYTTTPDGSNAKGSWATPTQLLQRIESDSSVSFVPISATDAPSFTWLGGVPVLALNNNGTINVYAGAQSGASLELTSSFTATSSEPAISSAPVLTTTNTGLALTYTNSDGSISLQRLNLVSSNGTPLPGVQFTSDGGIDVSQADLQWQSTILTESSSGISSSLASTPVSVNGNLLLTNVRNITSQDSQIWINAVPNASDPDSTTWLNSTVQLADGSGGWSISQEKVLTSALVASWSDTSGQSPVAPVFAQDPTTGVIFAAVQGTNAQIYWNYSSDGGSSWIGWMAGPGYTDAAPALTVLETSNGSFLVLAYLNNSNIYVSNLFIIDGNNAWSAPYQITDLAAETISLVTEANEVALYYQGINDPNVSVNEIYRAYTSTPDANSWSANATPLQYIPNNNSVFQTSSGQLVATVLDGTTYLAYQGGTNSNSSNTIYLTSSSTQINSASWNLISNLPQPLSPAHSGVGLTSFNGSLVLSYADQINSKPVVSLQQGDISNGNWSGSTYALLESVGDTSTPQSSLLAPSGSAQVLVGSISTTSAYTSNEILTTLTAPQSSANTSTLSAVGDLNSDGYSDLVVTANGVSANTANGNQSYTGLRVITGAATSAALVKNNNSTSTSQTVQLAGAFSSGSQVPVTAISGIDLTNGSIDLTIAANNGSKVSTLNATGLPATSLTTPVTSASGASQLLSGFSSTTTNLAQSSGWGNPSASTAGGYGDLDGDGQLDYLAPGGLDQLYTPDSTLDWNIWSIQAAGDVNGNGVDDVLLSLSPNGPSYTPLSNGQPSAVQTVLLDGSLFRVVNNQFSFAPPPVGSTPGTATTAGLRQPLNPFNQGEIIDTTSSSQSQYVGLLQNWFVPINTFQAGTPTSLTINQSSKSNPAGALSDSPPAAVVDAHGNATLIFTGTTPNKSPTTNNTIWCATQDKASGTWTQFATSITNAYTTSPSAVLYDGRLYVAYLDYSNNVWMSSCDASSPVTSSTTWTTYQVKANSAAVQTNFGAPALIVEAGRLAMYFPSYTGTKNSTSVFSEYFTYNVNYLYSSNPYLSSGTPLWGSAMSAGQFSGAPGALQFNYQGTSTDFVGGSQISAVTFQGKTVLAFAGQGGGAGTDWVIRVATAPSAQFVPGAAFEYFSTTQSNLDSPAVGIGLTTDQASLFVAATASYYETVGKDSGKTNYFTDTDLMTLRPKPSDEGQYVGYSQSQTTSTVFQSNDVPPPNASLSPAMYMQDGTVMLAGNTYGYNTIDVAAVDAVFGQAAQQSLSGFSIGGNIDNNGDGFTDMLISDPSDPALDLDNQYVLFGGDYLDIASQVGTGGDDTLIGTPLADVIYSLQGADQVISNGGADVIYTGSGNDQIAVKTIGTVVSSTGTQQVTGDKFIRVDGGSGFDQLLLQGLIDQAYDFQLATPSPTTIYAGTQLKNIELISSVDYGSNTLSFDEAAVNRINPDRVLFLALDPLDNAILSGFQRNKAFDTSYLGQLWLAYATGDNESPADSNPALVYVRNADTVTPQESVTAGRNQSSSVATSLQVSAQSIPVSNPIASVVSFGDGLQLVGYKASTAQPNVTYAIQRPAQQATARAVITYASTSIGSSNLELGPDASGVAGLLVMEIGETTKFISVPMDTQAVVNRKGGKLALIVNQIADVGQTENHIVVLPNLDWASQKAIRPVLSNYILTLGNYSMDALLSFRADVNLKLSDDATALAFTVAKRLTADSMVMTNSKPLVLLDSLSPTKSTSSTAYNATPDGYLLDHDGHTNAQVHVSIGLNFMTGNGLPSVILTGPDPQWSAVFTLQNGTELVFSSDVDLTVRRADTTTGKVSFGLQSVSGTAALTLLRDAVAGSSGSIDAQDMPRYASPNGWLASEGKAIGGVSTANNLALTGGTWTPIATRDGKALALQSLTQQGNQFTANFADGITGVYATPSVSGTLSSARIRPAVEVYRLGSYVNTFGFYELQDSITGTVNGLLPNDPGYLSTALAASKASGLFLDQSRLPGFGGQAIIHDLPLDTKQSYGVIFCVNGDSSTLFSSFAQANRGGATQMISLSNSSDAFTLGIEDQYMSKNSDNDYNDILVKISGVMVPIFG